MKPSTALIGIAGVHHVVSELSRRGMVALPTVRNTAAYDIVVLNAQGTRHANIQVKASSKKVSFFPMPPVAKVRDGRHDYYVLVRWLANEGRYECFMLTGKEARRATRSGSDHQGRSDERAARRRSGLPSTSRHGTPRWRRAGREPGKAGRYE